MDFILTAACHIHVGPLDYADLKSKKGDGSTYPSDRYALALGHLNIDDGSPVAISIQSRLCERIGGDCSQSISTLLGRTLARRPYAHRQGDLVTE